MSTRTTATIEIIWHPDVIVGCDILVDTIDGVEVGYAGRRPDGRWVAKVMHRADWSKHLEAYIGSVAQARRMVDRWLAHRPMDVRRLLEEREAWKAAMCLSPLNHTRARLASEQRMRRNPFCLRRATGLPW